MTNQTAPGIKEPSILLTYKYSWQFTSKALGVSLSYTSGILFFTDSSEIFRKQKKNILDVPVLFIDSFTKAYEI